MERDQTAPQKKKENAHQGKKVRPFESARKVGDRSNFRQRFVMVSWDDGEGWQEGAPIKVLAVLSWV